MSPNSDGPNSGAQVGRSGGREKLEKVVIRFAGDSGDGMQMTGDRFTSETAGLGNDLSTLPDFPAEIRAPAGTIGGVSAFQLAFADHDITMGQGEVAEFDTAVPHWFGAAGDEPVELLSLLGQAGERMHVRAAPRRRAPGA